MRPRVVATSTATLIAAASLSPMAAQAAGQNTIFVNSSSSACTDSGTGTVAAPYCTLQAAADAANPGDVVNVAQGTYAPATITRSGTASAPITFTGNGVRNAIGRLAYAATISVDVSGASYLKFQNFDIMPGSSAAAAVVDGGSDITFSTDWFQAATPAEPSLHVTDGASAVTVQDSIFYEQILVDGGSSGTILTTNRFSDLASNPISVVGAANTAITSNTVYGCGPAVSVTGSATGTSIENNVIGNPATSSTTTCPAPAQAEDGILVDASSASGTTSDYNDVYATGSAYDWAGTTYASAAALYAAAGQAQHDDNSLLGTETTEHSPLINSANSAAIGEQPLDLNGNPRVIDPLVTPTGAGPYNYYDRGAIQFQDPVTLTSRSITASATQAPVGGVVTLHASATDTWSSKFDYQFRINGSNGTLIDGGTSGTATASFSTPGDYAAYLYLAPTNGSPTPVTPAAYVQLVVVPAAPLAPQISATAGPGPYDVIVADSGTTDAWNITGVTYDFGDGTPTQTVATGASSTHTYAKAGTYTITETVTDADGNKATTSTRFSTSALTAGTLINLGSAQTTDVPANSTGIVQAAVGSLPNGTSDLVAATTAGTVEFATGNKNGTTWQSWQQLSQPGVTARWVGIAGMPNGSSQLIEVTSTGSLRHIVRNANGTWQSSGWGTPAGSTGFAHASITAMPDGSTQLLAVTTSGVLMHNIRFANGSWQGWRALSQPGVTIVDAGIAGMPDGSSQIVEVTSTQVMKHDIRYANGRWQPQGWAVPAGGTGIAGVSIAAQPAFSSTSTSLGAVISAVTTQGGVLIGMREANGSWSGWQNWSGTATGLGNFGTAANVTDATQHDTTFLNFAVAGG
ncbi:right-handed parallel beta-helix repeat-containing protein [Actinospica sp. MGRD01-02]|uniref:Right-handed parallel beta-helix repeat-containing protein n=1 Tax=Actinospica acidithermotolerans TaxID=2828514 RepID=A0A941E3Z5_9ACTN|nr:PKD domain-containing protein [Actinospica acidithermotolerans]MBR7824721.1 right-handed parallel beta-helix repeat-containing protein [Actinospica acidithermotolerans]